MTINFIEFAKKNKIEVNQRIFVKKANILYEFVYDKSWLTVMEIREDEIFFVADCSRVIVRITNDIPIMCLPEIMVERPVLEDVKWGD